MTNETQSMKKIYSKFTCFDDALQYMKEEDFVKGGWFVVYLQAQIIQTMAKEIKQIKNFIFNPFCSKKQEEQKVHWESLRKVCFDLSNEGFDIVFNPSQIRQYIDRHSFHFGNIFRLSENKDNGKYEVVKEHLLTVLSNFPHQNAAQRKLVSAFIEWRKSQKPPTGLLY